MSPWFCVCTCVCTCVCLCVHVCKRDWDTDRKRLGRGKEEGAGERKGGGLVKFCDTGQECSLQRI